MALGPARSLLLLLRSLTPAFAALEGHALATQETGDSPVSIGVGLPDPESLPRPEARALRIPTPPVIDGVLGDAAWSDAEAFSDSIYLVLNERRVTGTVVADWGIRP